jgi:hypothetical protein
MTTPKRSRMHGVDEGSWLGYVERRATEPEDDQWPSAAALRWLTFKRAPRENATPHECDEASE